MICAAEGTTTDLINAASIAVAVVGVFFTSGAFLCLGNHAGDARTVFLNMLRRHVPGLDPGAALHYRLKGGIRKDSQTLILTAPPHLDLQVLWAFGKTASPAGHQKGGPRALWTDLSETVQQSNGRKPRFGSPRISEDLSPRASSV